MKNAFEALLINVANLFKIKSLLTMLVIGTISYLVAKQIEVPSEYAAFGGSIMTYFYTKIKDKTD